MGVGGYGGGGKRIHSEIFSLWEYIAFEFVSVYYK